MIFFMEIFGPLCSSVFTKLNLFISSMEKTHNEWLIKFGFVTDSFHIDLKSFINNTRSDFPGGLWFSKNQ